MNTLQLNPGDQITVRYSHFVWKVISATDNEVKCRNCDGRKVTYTMDDVLGVVERKGDR